MLYYALLCPCSAALAVCYDTDGFDIGPNMVHN
jgi:hypothetical protein